MTYNARQAWDHATFVNESGEPLFLMPPTSTLSYDQITLSQRMPAIPDDVANGINSRQQAVTTTSRIGPTSKREIRSTPIHVANMYNIASIRLAETLEQHSADYNSRYGCDEAAPLVSLPKQLTEHQMSRIVHNVSVRGNTGNIVLTVGSDQDSPERMTALEDKLKSAGISVHDAIQILHFDNPNLNTPKAFADVKYWRERYPEAYLIAGNTDNPQTALYIAECGADAVKIGIGPGAMCTTRIKTGIGVPQASAVAAAVNALRNEDGSKKAHIIADGGVRYPKHWIYALALGADDIMFGSILGGYREGFETDADLESAMYQPEGSQAFFVPVYGSASKMALDNHHSEKDHWYKTPEGRSAGTKLKSESATTLVDDFRGGLRGALTQRGVGTVIELQNNAQFLPITGNHVDHSVNTFDLE